MKEHYVSYEQSQALKRLGFKEEVSHYYIHFKSDGEVKLWSTNPPDNHNARLSTNEVYSAPRLDQAAAWLREVKGIDVLVFNCACGYGWEISKAGNEQTRGTTIALFDDNGEDKDSGMWLSYESALSAGIDKALELLGKEVKE